MSRPAFTIRRMKPELVASTLASRLANPYHDRFARLVAGGLAPRLAYRRVYPDSSLQSARRAGWRLVRVPAVAARVSYYRVNTTADAPEETLTFTRRRPTSRKPQWLPVSALREHAFNHRLLKEPDPERWEVAVQGIMRAFMAGDLEWNPLLVTRDGDVLDGAKRLEAARRLGRDRLLCTVRAMESPEEAVLHMVRRNAGSLQRRQRTAICRLLAPWMFKGEPAEHIRGERLEAFALRTGIPLADLQADLTRRQNRSRQTLSMDVFDQLAAAVATLRGEGGVQLELRWRSADTYTLVARETRSSAELVSSMPGTLEEAIRNMQMRVGARQRRAERRTPEQIAAGRRLAEIRERLGLIQEVAAELVERSQPRYCEMETGWAGVKVTERAIGILEAYERSV